jgi:lipid A 3-O-deacylase
MRLAVLALLLSSTIAFAQTQSTSDNQKPADEKKQAAASDSLAASSENKGAWDLAVWGGGGHTVSGGVRNTSVGNAGFRIGKVLTAEHGSGWYRGNLEYAVDLIPLYILSGPFKPVPSGITCVVGVPCPRLVTNQTVYGGGFNPFVAKWNFTAPKRLSPYFELGGGVLFTNHEVPAFTSNVNFMSGATIGMNIFTREKRAFSLDFRYVHISNAGLASPNPGLNTVQGQIGYHWFK